MQGGLGYGEVKKELLEAIWNYFEPYREKKKVLDEDSEAVKKILKTGAEKAQSIAVETMKEVCRKVGI